MVRPARKSVSAPRADLPSAGPAPGRRERNKQEKRQRIVDAARRLFNEKGFEQTTTQQIAEAADIGTGTLFLYAKSKEDLLIMVFKDEMIATSQAAFEALRPRGRLLDQLMTVFEVMIDYHARDFDLARVLIKEISIPASTAAHKDIQILMREIYGGIGGLITAGQQHGKLNPDADPILAAEGLFAAYFLGLITWLSGMTSRRLFVSRLRKRLATLIRGLEVQGAGPGPRLKAARTD